MRTIVLQDVKDFQPDHVFECGQCFRWNLEDGKYVGIAAGNVARVSYDEDKAQLTLEVSGGDEKYWRHYFDLETDYSEIKSAIIDKEPKIKAACEYG